MTKSHHTIRFVGEVEVTLHTARRACEHFAFSGALVDFASSLFRMDAFLIVVFAKFCLLAGAIGVYLVHKEEQSRERKAQEREKEPLGEAA